MSIFFFMIEIVQIKWYQGISRKKVNYIKLSWQKPLRTNRQQSKKQYTENFIMTSLCQCNFSLTMAAFIWTFFHFLFIRPSLTRVWLKYKISILVSIRFLYSTNKNKYNLFSFCLLMFCVSKHTFVIPCSKVHVSVKLYGELWTTLLKKCSIIANETIIIH